MRKYGKGCGAGAVTADAEAVADFRHGHVVAVDADEHGETGGSALGDAVLQQYGNPGASSAGTEPPPPAVTHQASASRDGGSSSSTEGTWSG